MKPTKTEYKHIEFHEHSLVRDEKDVTVWICINPKHGVTLGWVEYYEDWKQNVFSAMDDTMIFSASCLEDIADFIKQLDTK
jgi:hypothetical protein